MSTQIKIIEGKYDISDGPYINVKPTSKDAELRLTRSEEKSYGKMLQLTILSQGFAYIQLTEEQVKELSIILSQCFDESIYPSE